MKITEEGSLSDLSVPSPPAVVFSVASPGGCGHRAWQMGLSVSISPGPGEAFVTRCTVHPAEIWLPQC